MQEFVFITGEKFRVRANDLVHAQLILNAYFMDAEPNDDVTEEDIMKVEYMEADTILID